MANLQAQVSAPQVASTRTDDHYTKSIMLDNPLANLSAEFLDPFSALTGRRRRANSAYQPTNRQGAERAGLSPTLGCLQYMYSALHRA